MASGSVTGELLLGFRISWMLWTCPAEDSAALSRLSVIIAADSAALSLSVIISSALFGDEEVLEEEEEDEELDSSPPMLWALQKGCRTRIGPKWNPSDDHKFWSPLPPEPGLFELIDSYVICPPFPAYNFPTPYSRLASKMALKLVWPSVLF